MSPRNSKPKVSSSNLFQSQKLIGQAPPISSPPPQLRTTHLARPGPPRPGPGPSARASSGAIAPSFSNPQQAEPQTPTHKPEPQETNHFFHISIKLISFYQVPVLMPGPQAGTLPHPFQIPNPNPKTKPETTYSHISMKKKSH